jgi:predicted short-subunit dehydrogenase-like oxidoreductase (DUF2520 family)
MTVTIIGTGKVAFHLGKRFVEKGVHIQQIIGRNADKAAWLASILSTNFETNFRKIKADSDIYIIAVSDAAIPSVAEQLSQTLDNQLVVHTSGSISSTILQPYFKNYGAFYPLQTFSLESQPDFDNIPIFINATPPQYLEFLKGFGEKISNKIYELEDDKRVVLHIAAVFVNNFTNQLFKMAYDILEKENLSFDVLKPLIQETVNKIHHYAPSDMQTGPAKRGDLITIEKHLNYLNKNAPPQYFDLYKMFTQLIEQ